jgi:signal transduction histidine kinase
LYKPKGKPGCDHTQDQNDGIGFDAKKAATQKTLGILGMKERTLVMGGSYTINCKPGKGTKVEVSVPVSQL